MIIIVVISGGTLQNFVLAQNNFEQQVQNTTRNTASSSSINEGIFHVNLGIFGSLDIPYSITGGAVNNMEVYIDKLELKVIVNTTNDGSLTVNVPPENSDGTFVFIDGEKSSYSKSQSGNLVAITVNFHAGDSVIEIIGKKNVLPSYSGPEHVVHDMTTNITSVEKNNMTYKSKIPFWIKNNAKYWHDGKIGDEDFQKGIQYLINNKIIKTTQNTLTDSGLKSTPKWIKNNAGMWADGTLSDDDFLKGIEYLVKIGIIKI